MNLLNIFHTGGVTLMLTIVWLGLTGWFGYQTYKIREETKKPYKKIGQVWFILFLAALYIFCLFSVASDYKGV